MSQSTTPYRIVVAFDFSELGERAVQQGLQLSNSRPSVELHVLTVGASQGELLKLPGIEPLSHAEASEKVRLAVAKITSAYEHEHPPLPLERIAVYASEGHPSEQIVALAEEIDADLIVIGTHGRSGLSRVMLGSVAEAVTRRAPCGVFVIRPRDFLSGEKLPQIQAPLEPGEHPLPHFRPRAVYHYVSRLQKEPDRLVPVA